MKRLIYISIIVMVVSCANHSKRSEIMSVDKETYLKDKQTISDSYIANVEYYRLYSLYGTATDTIDLIEHYKKYPYAEEDPANFFNPYACRFRKDGDFTNSPLPTSSQIAVDVDTIIYDKTGNLFVAFVCVENKYSKVSYLKDRGHFYEGRAMIGYRDTITDSIKVYPLTNFMAACMDTREIALYLVKHDYMTYLKGSYLAGSVYGTNKFNTNVGDIDFFEKSQYFQKYDSTHYYFQMYSGLDEIEEYKYPYGN